MSTAAACAAFFDFAGRLARRFLPCSSAAATRASRQAVRRVENRLATTIERRPGAPEPEIAAAGLLALAAGLARRAVEEGALRRC